MRLLVTGATGFIGSHFVNAASAAGHQVLALRRPGSVPRVQVADSVRWLEKTLASVTASDCDAVDAVSPFAAHGVSPKATTWQDAFESNVLGSVRLL
jgi:nucleoside-diphosphate-sugar epimerase